MLAQEVALEPRNRILLVEDDARLAQLVKEYLEHSDAFDVSVEARGDTAVDRIIGEQPDLVILDVMLPGLDGLGVLKQVRERYAGPILMLTALGDEVDEVVGLEIGADDYVAKPASPRKVLARVRSLLRRVPASPSAVEPALSAVIAVGELVVDPGRRAALLADQELDLTTAEFDLLHLLAQHVGETLEREAIYKELRGIEWDGLDRSIDLRVLRLRKKLGDDAAHPRFIKSVRGVGYLLARQEP
jgi:two-component system response regulator RstA